MVKLEQLRILAKKRRDNFLATCINGIEYFIEIEIAKGKKELQVDYESLHKYLSITFCNIYNTTIFISFIEGIKNDIVDEINSTEGFKACITKESLSKYDSLKPNSIYIEWE